MRQEQPDAQHPAPAAQTLKNAGKTWQLAADFGQRITVKYNSRFLFLMAAKKKKMKAAKKGAKKTKKK